MQHGPAKAVADNNTAALRVDVGIVWQWLIVRAHGDFHGVILDDGLHALPYVECVEGGDGETVEDDGEEREPVDDRVEGLEHVCFFLGLFAAELGEEVLDVLGVEDGTDT